MPKKPHPVDIHQHVHETQSPNQNTQSNIPKDIHNQFDPAAVVAAQVELLRKWAALVVQQHRMQQDNPDEK